MSDAGEATLTEAAASVAPQAAERSVVLERQRFSRGPCHQQPQRGCDPGGHRGSKRPGKGHRQEGAWLCPVI